jgi:nucleotidyltransferase/DNA polymerase involved in DNA repair
VRGSLEAIAREFSPRYECDRDHLVTIDVSGLERLFSARGHAEPRTCESEAKRQRQFAPGVGSPAPVKKVNACGHTTRSVWNTIGEEMRREAASRGVRVHVAVAGTRMAALVLALARPGVTIVEPGEHAEALAPIPIGILEKIHDDRPSSAAAPTAAVSALKRWGLKTLGELAALPPADLSARLGRQGLLWQAIARGDDVRPLIPTLAEERFESSMELEWPIEGLEPLSFVLTRLLEPLSTRLERRDRGAAVLHVMLRLVTKEVHACRLELPSPMRDVRTLRTLALLDLESHPPAAAIDRVTIVIDPTPGRVLQHTLFTRAHPTPEQISTLLARLGAVMGQDRLGAPVAVDSYRPGAFAMAPFATEHDVERKARKDTHNGLDTDLRRPVLDTREAYGPSASSVGDTGLRRPVLDTREGHGPSVSGVGDTGLRRPVLDTREGHGASASGVGDTGLRRPVLDTREGHGASASGVGDAGLRRPVLDTR